MTTLPSHSQFREKTASMCSSPLPSTLSESMVNQPQTLLQPTKPPVTSRPGCPGSSNGGRWASGSRFVEEPGSVAGRLFAGRRMR